MNDQQAQEAIKSIEQWREIIFRTSKYPSVGQRDSSEKCAAACLARESLNRLAEQRH